MKTIAIYHKDCTDGTTAAAVVLRKYPDALVFPLSHGHTSEELSAILEKIEKGDRVFTVDCIIGVNELLAAGHAVTSLDHHIGAEKAARELEASNKAFTFVFDNDKSGASLAWSYFFPDEKIPELVLLVEDRDLWRHKYGQRTKAASNFLFMLTNKPDEVAKLLNAPIDGVLRDGTVLARSEEISIDHKFKTTEPILVRVDKYEILFYNATSYRSDLGNAFAVKNAKAVGLFSITGGSVHISFRSLDGQSPNALELAKALGGGGHNNAAAASMKLSDFIKSIVLP